MTFDICVVGAGLVGLATARELLIRHPALRIVVIDQERCVAAHQSSHNSGVLHAGLYYPPGSLKARLCLEGRASLERLAVERGIPYERCGKVVVAVRDSERSRLAELFRRGVANGVPGVRFIGPEELVEIEPHAAGVQALHVPSTAIIDFGRVAAEFARDFEDRGGHIRLNCKLRSVRQQPGGRVLDTTSGVIEATKLISCAGLWADRVARMTATHRTDPTSDQRIVPFRGDYYTLRPRARHLVRGLIYPVPDPRYPFLGIHFTRRTDGEIWAGPNAVLAASRAGYRRLDVRPRDLVETVGFRGFRRLARNYWRTGISEMWRDISKPAFVRELQRYVPSIQGDDVRFGPSGVRAQAVGADGVLVDDFSLIEAADILHVCNAPSPAATASPAIGRELADRADRAFGLTA